MSKQPPLLPAESLRRVLRVARTNGTSVLLIAGFVALASAASQDRIDTVVGLLASASGALEIHGASQIARGDSRGLRWLVFSQVFLLAVILGYVAFRVSHVDLSLISSFFGDPLLKQTAEQSGMTVPELKLQLYSFMYLMVAIGTLIYQGWMIFYYGRNRRAVTAALTQH